METCSPITILTQRRQGIRAMTDGIFEAGREAYRKKEFERAVELFESLLRTEAAAGTMNSTAPSREDVLLKLAAAYDELERYEAALTSLKELLELNRDSAQGWNNLAVVCQKLGRIEEARAAFEQAYRLQPENAVILISLGSIALKLSDPSRALEYLKLAIELDPGHPAAHANLSLTFAVFGRLEEAEDELRLAAFYGYEHADTVQDKLDMMKRVRDEILTGKNSGETEDRR